MIKLLERFVTHGGKLSNSFLIRTFMRKHLLQSTKLVLTKIHQSFGTS